MAKFADSEGREWDLSLNVGLVSKLRTDAGFELGKTTSAEKLGEALFADPETFAKVLWVCIQQQAEKKGIDPNSFAFALDGDTIEKATTALMLAIIDFFHRRGPGKVMAARLPEILTDLDNKLTTMTQKALNERLGK